MENDLAIREEKMTQNMQAFAFREGIRAEIRMREHFERNQMDLAKMEFAEKQRSDIRAERTLQKKALLVSEDGELILARERFSGSLQKGLAIRNFYALWLSSKMNSEKHILNITFRFGSECSGRNVKMFLDGKRLGEQRYVNQVFVEAGVSFRFRRAEEDETRMLIINMARNRAEEVMIPEAHGWYKGNNGWEYAYPGDLCWKEVVRWI